MNEDVEGLTMRIHRLPEQGFEDGFESRAQPRLPPAHHPPRESPCIPYKEPAFQQFFEYLYNIFG